MEASTAALFTSKTAEHNTPADIAQRVRAVLQGIELDPASSDKANETIQADRYICDPFAGLGNTPADLAVVAQRAAQGGLRASWQCRTLYLNPPFSVPKRTPLTHELMYNGRGKPIRERVIHQWVNRLLLAWKDKEIREAAILLIPARVDTQWFRPLWRRPMCFVEGRLAFSESENSAPFPTVLVYFGQNERLFYTVFDDVGQCGKLVADRS